MTKWFRALLGTVLVLKTFVGFGQQAQVQDPSSLGGGTQPPWQQAEEFESLRGLSASLYAESLSYWQNELRKEAAQGERQEAARLERLEDEAQSEEQAWRDELESTAESLGTPRGSQPLEPSRERELLILAQSYLALADLPRQSKAPRASSRSQDQARDRAWQRVRARLAPFREELKGAVLRPDVRALAATLLAQSELIGGQPSAAMQLLNSVLPRLVSADTLPTPNVALAHLVAADALMAMFRYRDARQQVVLAESQAQAMPQQNEELLRLIRVRKFWTSYRSGDYEGSIVAFRLSCSEDALFWQAGGDDDGRALFVEMSRLAGTVLFRSQNNALVQDVAGDRSLGPCRAAALASFITRLGESGRFANAVSGFLEHYALLDESPQLPSLTSNVYGWAGRDRQEVNRSQGPRVMAVAAPLLIKGGAWERRYGNDLVESNRRALVVGGPLLQAADALYEEGFRAVSASRGPDARAAFLQALDLYTVRLAEGDSFEGRAKMLMRMGHASDGLDRLEESMNHIGSALAAQGSGLVGQDRRLAYEMRCDLAKRMAWRGRSGETLSRWIDSCSELVRSYPTGRSLTMLVDAVRESAEQQSALGHSRLTEAVGLVARNPLEFTEVGSKLAQVLVMVAGRVLSGHELLIHLAEREVLLRQPLGDEGVFAIEQASFSFLTSEVEALVTKGDYRRAVEWMDQWLVRVPENTFAPAVLWRLVQFRYETRSWQEVVEKGGLLVALMDGKIQTPGRRSFLQMQDALTKAGVVVEWAQARLLYALGLEAMFRFDEAMVALLNVEQNQSDPQAAQQARSLLLQRYHGKLSSDESDRILRGVAGSSQATLSDIHQAIVLGLERALQDQNESRLAFWVARGRRALENPPSGDGHEVLGIIMNSGVFDTDPQRSGAATRLREALPVLVRDGAAVVRQGQLSMAQHAQIQSVVSGALVRWLRQGRGAETLVPWLDSCPPQWLTAEAGLRLAEVARQWDPQWHPRVAIRLLDVLRSEASSVGRKTLAVQQEQTKTVNALLQMVVVDLGYRPTSLDAAGLVDLVGPSRFLPPDGVSFGVKAPWSASVREGVLHD
jgi:hypothetical protein